jgi:hypothetical protein
VGANLTRCASDVSLLLQGEYAKGYGAVLDSGTTFTYLPTAAFNAFLELLNEALQGKGVYRSSGADPEVRLEVSDCDAAPKLCCHDLRLTCVVRAESDGEMPSCSTPFYVWHVTAWYACLDMG